MMEKAHLCRARGARLAERITLQQSTHPDCLRGKDPDLNRATASRRHLQTTARPGALEQCRNRDVHQDYYVVVKQEDGTNPKPAQRFRKETFLHWAAKLKSQGGEIYAVYEACGFGFGLQRQLAALGIQSRA
jgi:hypothetical protein